MRNPKTPRTISFLSPISCASAVSLSLVSAVSAATVWNVNLGVETGGNAITTTDNVVGAAPENTVNSTWSNFNSAQSATLIPDSTGTVSTVAFSLSSPGGGLNTGSNTLTASGRMFLTWLKDDGNNEPLSLGFSGLTDSPLTTYSVMIYGAWRFGPEVVEVSQTAGSGLVGTFFFNNLDDEGSISGFAEDADAGNVAGDFNYVRFDGLTPDASGVISFQYFDDGGEDASISGIQLIETTIPEPSSVFCGLLGLTAFMRRRR